MTKISICSKNPVKILAVREAFDLFFEKIEVTTLDMNQFEKVSRQPMSADETLQSALSRVQIARTLEKSDYYVSMEGGLAKDQYGSFLTWYVCVSNSEGKISLAGGGRMAIPSIIYETLIKNPSKELGEIMDELVGRHNIKQKGGSTAIFTDNVVMRKDVFKRDIIFSLIPFVNDVYKKIENMPSL